MAREVGPFRFRPEGAAILATAPTYEGFPPLSQQLATPAALETRVGEWQEGGASRADAETLARFFPSTPPEVGTRWAQIRTEVADGDESAAPFLQPQRLSRPLFPLQDPEVFEFRKLLERLHWVAQEIDLSRDKHDLARATEGDRRLLEAALGFFAVGDELVLEGLEERVMGAFPSKEAAYYLREQLTQECVHSEAYSLQVSEVIPRERREAVYEAVLAQPEVGRMADWIRWWVYGDHPVADLTLVLAFTEGVLFSGFFAALHHFRTRNLFPGITGLNEFICRDEGVHTLFWCFVLTKRLDVRPSPATVESVARETVAMSTALFEAAAPEKDGGLSGALIAQYVRFAADSVAVQAGYAPVFGDPNPFPFMETLALNQVAKTNFFEAPTTGYQSLGRPGALAFRADAPPLEEP